jgi:hypothetical protein
MAGYTDGMVARGLNVWLDGVGEGIKALGASWTLLNANGVSFRVVQFEIWEGGQRSVVIFNSLMENADQSKDRNHAIIQAMAQSLRLNKTESASVN